MTIFAEVKSALQLEELIFDSSIPFLEKALEVFRFQVHSVPVYREFCSYLSIEPTKITSFEAIPFLPIELFKSHTIIADGFSPKKIFASSGTTGSQTSEHCITSLDLYEKSILNGFKTAKGDPKNYCILGLLPSYLERDNASLVYMVDFLMKESGHQSNGFYLDDFEKLANTLKQLEASKQPTLLIGVTFALLDFAEQFSMPLNHVKVTETGGMKGRRKELVREEVHALLHNSFPGIKISSEYGMTELLSQAYLLSDGKFHPASTLKVLPRELNDPFSSAAFEQTAAFNVIDLANIYSCSFIATQDIGRVYSNGSFDVLGRMDHSDLRGCNLMIATP